MSENNGLARAWLQTIESRGVTFSLGPTRRLRLAPARAYSELSDEEVVFLRHNREAIKELVRLGPLPKERATPTPVQKDVLAAPVLDVPRHTPRDLQTRIETPSNEQNAASIRKNLGWDQGVWNETTGYRHRE